MQLFKTKWTKENPDTTALSPSHPPRQCICLSHDDDIEEQALEMQKQHHQLPQRKNNDADEIEGSSKNVTAQDSVTNTISVEENSGTATSIDNCKLKYIDNSTCDDSINSSNNSSTNEDSLTRVLHDPGVQIWRIVVLIVLLGSTIGAAITVYHFAYEQETKDFQVEFHNYGTKILESIQKSLYLTLCSIDAMSVSMVSAASATNQKWPFVTFDHFAIRSSKLRSLSKSFALILYPYVTEANRDQWENYTSFHNHWVAESIEVQRVDDTYHGTILENYTTTDFIHNFDYFVTTPSNPPNSNDTESNHNNSDHRAPSKHNEYYLPSWQSAPVISSPNYNFDMLSVNCTQAGLELIKTHQVIFTEAYGIPVIMNDQMEAMKNEDEFDNIYLKRKHLCVTGEMTSWGTPCPLVEPVSDIHYPIINKLNTVRSPQSSGSESDSDSDFVGSLSLSIYWKDMMENILYGMTYSMILVFHNPCQESFSYRMTGPKVTYLGLGDLHNRKYNLMVESMSLFDINSKYRADWNQYTGVTVNTKYCPFTLNVYPDEDMEAFYKTIKPAILTVGVILVFSFTSAVFLIFNYWVEKRQRKVLKCAIESTINAHELDKIVRDRTISLQRTNDQLEYANNQIQKASALQLEHFACMSHEIRTPLNGINGLSSVLRDDIENIMKMTKKLTSSSADKDIGVKEDIDKTLTESLLSSYESIQMIFSSGELLRTIVDDVLDFAKLGSGKVEVDIQKDINLQEILNTVLSSVESNELVQSKQLSIKSLYGSTVSKDITTDGRRLQQILYNLFGNAIKFSHIGGIIEFQVHHHFLCDPSVLRFVVKDYGKGIAREKFEAIFQPFIQAEGASTEKSHGGTGLGLAITSRLVEALGGTISVDSEVGKWTQFTIDFPIIPIKAFEQQTLYEEQSITQNSGKLRCNCPIVDTDLLSSGLKSNFVFLLDDNIENTQYFDRVVRDYKINYSSSNCYAELLTLLNSCKDGLQPVILIREGMVDQSIIQNLKLKAKIIKFGVKNDIQSQSCTLRSHPVRLLPSVLLKYIADYDEIKGKQDTNISCAVPPIDEKNDDSTISNLRILVAEDNKVNQKVILRILNRLKITNIVLVDNGRSAVDRESIEVFDLIFMDMHMPILDGIDACREIVKRGEGTSLRYPIPKIIFLTAHVSDEFEKECYKAGAVGFLTKPCTIEDISKCIHRLISNDISADIKLN